MPHIIKNLILFVKPIIWLAIITVLCFIPSEDLTKTPLVNIPNFDKIVHFGMYFILAVLLARPLKTVGIPIWPVTLLISILAGGMIEILQFVITNYRSASWYDFLADFVGAVTGLLVFGILFSERHWEKYI